MELKNRTLSNFADLVQTGECKKFKEADAFVSAGSSGAVLVGGQVIVGRIKGIQRPPLAPLIPTERGVSLLIDCGANVDARAEHLVQFAKMGSIYMEHVVGVKNPKVALVNIGAEEEKGNALVKETMPLLRECTDINFVGSIVAVINDTQNLPLEIDDHSGGIGASTYTGGKQLEIIIGEV